LKNNNAKAKALQFLGITALLLLLCSCLSFDIGDWPSRFVYPHNTTTANLCGRIGAFCSYYLLYHIGPGIFVILISGIVFLAVRLAGRTIGQPVFRTIGLILLTTAASATFYSFWPYKIYEFPTGSGGVLGVATVQFLKGHFASLGTFILLCATWFVGLILLADTLALSFLSSFRFLMVRTAGLFLPAFSAARKHSEVLGEIWQKLSLKQKAVPAGTRAGRLEQDMRLERLAEKKRRLMEAGSGSETDSGAEEQSTGKSDSPVLRIKERRDLKRAGMQKEPPLPTSYQAYALPSLKLLDEPERGFAQVQEKVVKAKAQALENLLSEFSINARVVEADTGPVVTMFELELAPGVKVNQISALSNDMARALGAGAVRVVAPLPGKHTIGIEVPNSEKEKVRIKDMFQLAGGKPRNMQIPLYLGKDSSGEALVSDLTEMPHLLIAGTTGSGKSVCINSIITGILFTKRPDEVKTILIDPKMVEMTAFNNIPHLMCPIVTETKQAVQILSWASMKMDERYALLAEARVKNVAEYNMLGSEEILERFRPDSEDEAAKIPKKIPYIVIVIDELADLMMTAAKEIESYIVRLAQKSRAVGIHIVLATQRPQATVVTGLIKSNMPCRIGFRVAARMDSRIILDQNGAETLLGEGDMLFLKPGTSDLVRAQGTFVDDTEVRRIVKYLKEIAEPQFHPELTQLNRLDVSQVERDELFDEAVRVVLETHRGSVSLLQRRLNVGYARASRMIETMAALGVLGEYKGSQARKVMMTIGEYEQLQQKMDSGAAACESRADSKDAESSFSTKDKANGASDSDASNGDYQPSAEGEYHYAAIDDEQED